MAPNILQSMSPVLLRQLWKVIDESPTTILLELDSHALSNQLLDEVQDSNPLTREDRETLRHYIQSHSPLIHDIVRSHSAWLIQPIQAQPA